MFSCIAILTTSKTHCFSVTEAILRHQQSMLLKSSRIHSNHDDLPQSEERKLSTWLCIFLATTWKEATRAISHQTKYLTPRLLKALRNYNILVIINSSLDSDNMFHIDKKKNPVQKLTYHLPRLDKPCWHTLKVYF